MAFTRLRPTESQRQLQLKLLKAELARREQQQLQCSMRRATTHSESISGADSISLDRQRCLDHAAVYRLRGRRNPFGGAVMLYLPLNKTVAALPPMPMSHEDFLVAIRDAAIARLNDNAAKDKLRATKLTYGAAENVRGVCYSQVWQNGHVHDLICISACGEENSVQLAGTCLHELGHALATCANGHNREWKSAARALGLLDAMAAGQEYRLSDFSDDLQAVITQLEKPNDGVPRFQGAAALGINMKFRPCGAGIGARGGKSRGKGSGSRLRKYVCDCGQIVRASTDNLQAHCDLCGSEFKTG